MPPPYSAKKMAKINNRRVVEEIENTCFLDPAESGTITQVDSKVIPVVIGNPKEIINISGQNSATATGSVTLYTTPSDTDFYLVGAFISVSYDAAQDGTYVNLIGTIKGSVANELAQLRKHATTAYTANVMIPFPKPILMERGTTITLVDSYAAGTGSKAGTVFGFVVDPQ